MAISQKVHSAINYDLPQARWFGKVNHLQFDDLGPTVNVSKY